MCEPFLLWASASFIFVCMQLANWFVLLLVST